MKEEIVQGMIRRCADFRYVYPVVNDMLVFSDSLIRDLRDTGLGIYIVDEATPPSYIGLIDKGELSSLGRPLDKCCYAHLPYSPRDTPHIVIQAQMMTSPVVDGSLIRHEIAHVIDFVLLGHGCHASWKDPLRRLLRIGKPVTEYACNDSVEQWAEAVMAYYEPETIRFYDKIGIPCEYDLFECDPGTYEYIRNVIGGSPQVAISTLQLQSRLPRW